MTTDKERQKTVNSAQLAMKEKQIIHTGTSDLNVWRL